MIIRIILALILGLGALSIDSMITTIPDVHPEWFWSGEWPAKIIGFVVSMALLISIALVLSGGRISRYGFKIVFAVGSLPITAVCFIAGALATLIGHLAGGGGLDFAKDYTFLQIVIFIWIFRSIIEESIFRGLVQSFLEPLGGVGLNILRWRISFPVIIGALIFALVHLMLLTMGTDLSTVLIIVVFALFLGLMAGYSREKSGSLIPAIMIHALFNIGGTAAGYGIDLF